MASDTNEADHLENLPVQIQDANDTSFPDIIARIIASEDKLLFIAYSVINAQRKEWKLV